MNRSMYARSKIYRNAAALLLALMLALAAYKVYSSWLKTDLYAKASAEQAAGHLLEAEELYLKAERIAGFDYRSDEIAEALSVLRPVTDLKRKLAAMTEDVSAAAQVNDVPTLVRTYGQFLTLQQEYAGKDDEAKKLFAENEAVYQVEPKLNEAFAASKSELLKSIDTVITKKTVDNDTAIAYLAQIPAVYFKDEKTKKQQLAAKLKAYDQMRLDALSKSKPFGEVLTGAAGIRQFYEANGVQADWLQPLLETYVQNTLAALLRKNDLKTFIADAQTYQSSKEWFDTKSKVSAYIQSTMRSQFTRAEQLVATRKFDDALELYSQLSAYQNTDKEVQALQQHRLESDPVQLLRSAVHDAAAKFTSVISAKATASTPFTAAGIVDDTLVFARLGANQTIEKAETALERKLTVKSLTWSDALSMRKLPVLIVEAASKARKARYIAYEADGSELKPLLDIEADGFTQEKPGSLLVENPTGEAAGKQAVFEYQGGQYAFAGVKAGVTDILLTELPKQKLGSPVRFQCSIAAVDGNTATVLLNREIVLLTGSVKLKPGPAVITGTYFDKSRVILGNPPQSTIAYQVQVTAAEQ